MKFKFNSKGLLKRKLEDFGDGPMSSYCKVLKEINNVTSTSTGFRTIQCAVATYEQTKKGLSHLYPQKNVEQDGIHPRHLIFLLMDDSI